MTLRHAAALALVGWYLMMPPEHRFDDHPDPQAPLTKWQDIEGGDTAMECHDALDKHIESFDAARDALATRDALAKHTPSTADNREAMTVLEFWLSCKCIASDDPRLKEK